jgi:hypothetical protein
MQVTNIDASRFINSSMHDVAQQPDPLTPKQQASKTKCRNAREECLSQDQIGCDGYIYVWLLPGSVSEQVVVRLSGNLHSLHNRKATVTRSFFHAASVPAVPATLFRPRYSRPAACQSNHLPIPWIIRPVHGNLKNQSGHTPTGCVRESCRFGWPCSDPIRLYLKPSHT